MDGLHNNGKSTQIALLYKYLTEKGIPVLVRRGDGMRSGVGKDLNDSISIWWQENITRLRATGFEGESSMNAAEEAANRLNREIRVAKEYFMPKLLEAWKKDIGVILLDRGHISRLFVKRREDKEADFESIKFFKGSGNQQEVLIPDITFLFHTSLEVLLDRNDQRETSSDKKDFNRTVLLRYYDDFEDNISRLPDVFCRGLVRIDATKPVEEIHKIIVEYTNNLIEEKNTKIEFQKSGKERR